MAAAPVIMMMGIVVLVMLTVLTVCIVASSRRSQGRRIIASTPNDNHAVNRPLPLAMAAAGVASPDAVNRLVPAPVVAPGDVAARPVRDTQFIYTSGDRPLDGYTIKRGIGRGGFGEVYYAVSDGGKEVALKLVQRHLDVELRGVGQCLNLKHPNLVTIYDVRQAANGDYWVVMEYLSGSSLSDVLAANPNGLPPDQVLAWLHGMCNGVADLHEHGIVHRDLKPGNIFVEQGIVKIGDYGLAKFISASRRSGQTESVGTVHYMAPEIAHGRYGKEIDLYAVGIILYELLTGRVPFDGQSPGEIMMKHLTAQPDVSGLLEPYRSVVARLLAKAPEERYESVKEILDELTGEGAARPVRQPGTSPEPVRLRQTMSWHPQHPHRPVRARSKAQPLKILVAIGLSVATAAAAIGFLRFLLYPLRTGAWESFGVAPQAGIACAFVGLLLLTAYSWFWAAGSSHIGRSLVRATARGDSSRVRELIAEGADVNAKGQRGFTALMHAAGAGRTGLVELLLERAANVNDADHHGRTALIYAASGGHTGIVELLLEHGAEVNARERGGYTALIGAAKRGHAGCVEVLLKHGADPNARAQDDCTALTWAAYNGHAACVKALLDKGADPNVKESGSTALIWAIDQNHAAVVQLLLSRGADPHEPADDGESPLDKAESPRIVSLLKAAIGGRSDAAIATDSEIATDDKTDEQSDAGDDGKDEGTESSRAAVAHLVGWGLGLFAYGVCQAGDLLAHSMWLGIGVGIVAHALVRLLPVFSFLDYVSDRAESGWEQHAPHLGWGVGIVCYALTHSLDGSIFLSIGAGMLSAGIVSLFVHSWNASDESVGSTIAVGALAVALVGSLGWLLLRLTNDTHSTNEQKQLSLSTTSTDKHIDLRPGTHRGHPQAGSMPRTPVADEIDLVFKTHIDVHGRVTALKDIATRSDMTSEDQVYLVDAAFRHFSVSEEGLAQVLEVMAQNPDLTVDGRRHLITRLDEVNVLNERERITKLLLANQKKSAEVEREASDEN